MNMLNEAAIYRLFMNHRLDGHVDYDQFFFGMETECKRHRQLSEEELVELVVKKLEIVPNYYTARTESSIEEVEPIGERERSVLPRKIGKPRRSRIESTLPPGEREENPAVPKLTKLRRLLEKASEIVDEVWLEDTGNIGISQAKIHIMDAYDLVIWEITGEPPSR